MRGVSREKADWPEEGHYGTRNGEIPDSLQAVITVHFPQ